jgi:hypothetical protein
MLVFDYRSVLSVELVRIYTSYFSLPHWPLGDIMYLGRRDFFIFGPREPHYRCIKDCAFGEILWGMYVSIKSGEVPFLGLIGKTIRWK